MKRNFYASPRFRIGGEFLKRESRRSSYDAVSSSGNGCESLAPVIYMKDKHDLLGRHILESGGRLGKAPSANSSGAFWAAPTNGFDVHGHCY